MTIKCPFCTEKEIEAKGCAHKLLTLKIIFPSEIIQDLSKEQIITDEEMKSILNKQVSDVVCEKLINFAYSNDIDFGEIELYIDKINDKMEIDSFIVEFLDVYKDLNKIIMILIDLLDALNLIYKEKEVCFDYVFSDDEENFLTIKKVYFYKNKAEISKKIRDIIFVLFNLPIEISFFELSKLWYKEKKNGMIIFTAMHEERTNKIYPFVKCKSQLSPELLLTCFDFYAGFLNLLKKDPVLCFDLINLGKEIFCEHMIIIGRSVFTGNEKFKEITEEQKYAEKIDKLFGLIFKTRRILEEVEEKFIFSELPGEENLKTKKEKLEKAVSLGLINEIIKNGIFYYWKLLSNYIHYNQSYSEDLLVNYLQMYNILHQSYLFLVYKLIPYINLKGLIKIA